MLKYKSEIATLSTVPAETVFNMKTKVKGLIEVPKLTVKNLANIDGTLSASTGACNKNFLCSSDLRVNGPSVLKAVTLVNEGLINNSLISNVGDPSVDMDALTFNTIVGLTPKIIYGGGYTSSSVQLQEDWTHSGQQDFYSPGARDYFQITQKKLYLYKPGLYQIGYGFSRTDGQDTGTDDKEAIVFLKLTAGDFSYVIGNADTRSWEGSWEPNPTEMLLIEIPFPGPVGSNTYLWWEAHIKCNLSFFCYSITWFPQKYY